MVSLGSGLQICTNILGIR